MKSSFISQSVFQASKSFILLLSLFTLLLLDAGNCTAVDPIAKRNAKSQNTDEAPPVRIPGAVNLPEPEPEPEPELDSLQLDDAPDNVGTNRNTFTATDGLDNNNNSPLSIQVRLLGSGMTNTFDETVSLEMVHRMAGADGNEADGDDNDDDDDDVFGRNDRRSIAFQGKMAIPEDWDVDGGVVQSVPAQLRALSNFEKRAVCYLTDTVGINYKLDFIRDEAGIRPRFKELTCTVVRPWVQRYVRIWKSFI